MLLVPFLFLYSTARKGPSTLFDQSLQSLQSLEYLTFLGSTK